MQTTTPSRVAQATGFTSAPGRPIDWEAAIRLPAFAALVRSRRRFVAPAAVGAFAWITAWLVLVGYAHDVMGREIAPGVSVMLVTGLSQFGLVWALTVAYLRLARDVWGPLQREAIAQLEATLAGERP